MKFDEIRRIEQVYASYEQAGRWNNPGPGRKKIEEERTVALDYVLARSLPMNLAECRILDLGCGGGGLLNWFHRRGARPENLTGIDLLSVNIENARLRYPEIDFRQANAEQLKFPDRHFSIICIFTVFSSVLNDETAKNISRSVCRVLGRPGIVIWYDLRYPSPHNPNVRAMTRARIQRLFPDFTADLQPLTLLPPIADRLGPLTDLLYPMLTHVPGLRSHLFGTLSAR